MRHLSWIVTLPFAAIVVMFAVNNRDPVVLDLWPLDVVVTAPAFLLVLGAAVTGFLAGGFVVWIAAIGRRREVRRRDRRIDTLEREVGRLQDTTRAAPASGARLPAVQRAPVPPAAGPV
ncbi:MAG: lipopolysaccharide assembly protein LapA domain-containing protein [Alphaproteobacteria bacterium]